MELLRLASEAALGPFWCPSLCWRCFLKVNASLHKSSSWPFGQDQVCYGNFPGDTVVKKLPANEGDARDAIQSLGREDPPE